MHSDTPCVRKALKDTATMDGGNERVRSSVRSRGGVRDRYLWATRSPPSKEKEEREERQGIVQLAAGRGPYGTGHVAARASSPDGWSGWWGTPVIELALGKNELLAGEQPRHVLASKHGLFPPISLRDQLSRSWPLGPGCIMPRKLGDVQQGVVYSWMLPFSDAPLRPSMPLDPSRCRYSFGRGGLGRRGAKSRSPMTRP